MWAFNALAAARSGTAVLQTFCMDSNRTWSRAGTASLMRRQNPGPETINTVEFTGNSGPMTRELHQRRCTCVLVSFLVDLSWVPARNSAKLLKEETCNPIKNVRVSRLLRSSIGKSMSCKYTHQAALEIQVLRSQMQSVHQGGVKGLGSLNRAPHYEGACNRQLWRMEQVMCISALLSWLAEAALRLASRTEDKSHGDSDFCLSHHFQESSNVLKETLVSFEHRHHIHNFWLITLNSTYTFLVLNSCEREVPHWGSLCIYNTGIRIKWATWKPDELIEEIRLLNW